MTRPTRSPTSSGRSSSRRPRLLQYLEVANAPRELAESGRTERWRLITWEPGRIDWIASVVQLAGTFFFNASTFHAMSENLSASEANRLVWAPDALGSIAFLVASGLAWAEVSHGWWSWRPRSISWWITALNLAGSIAFGVSAIASKVIPETDQVRNVTLMNLGTFLGALGFLIGAILLLPERTEAEEPPTPSPEKRAAQGNEVAVVSRTGVDGDDPERSSAP